MAGREHLPSSRRDFRDIHTASTFGGLGTHVVRGSVVGMGYDRAAGGLMRKQWLLLTPSFHHSRITGPHSRHGPKAQRNTNVTRSCLLSKSREELERDQYRAERKFFVSKQVLGSEGKWVKRNSERRGDRQVQD